MRIRWPLEVWRDKIGVASTTRRSAILGGTLGRPTETSLGHLRRFVESLEQWPDEALVQETSGAVLHVEFYAKADDLVRKPGGSGSNRG